MAHLIRESCASRQRRNDVLVALLGIEARHVLLRMIEHRRELGALERTALLAEANLNPVPVQKSLDELALRLQANQK